ncbi:MAG: hypothetical protein ACRDS9_27020, partial [Pseudonocardiaceae bacterium]
TNSLCNACSTGSTDLIRGALGCSVRLMTDLVPKANPEDIANGRARYTGAESLVHRKVSVKGSGGVSATVVITVQQGRVRMSIHPPSTWEAIMEPWKVDELIQTLLLAAERAKRMAMRYGPD